MAKEEKPFLLLRLALKVFVELQKNTKPKVIKEKDMLLHHVAALLMFYFGGILNGTILAEMYFGGVPLAVNASQSMLSLNY
jgi:hypothetical protein